jgi:archaellum component FlaG (FlaF/FlaG flagellin family)
MHHLSAPTLICCSAMRAVGTALIVFIILLLLQDAVGRQLSRSLTVVSDQVCKSHDTVASPLEACVSFIDIMCLAHVDV